MSDEPVCVRCQHLFIVHKADQWFRYLCLASPRKPTYNPVLGEKIADPPYYHCKDINHLGCCNLFVPGVNDYQPRRIPDGN